MSTSSSLLARDTLTLLEERLRRIDHAVNGSPDHPLPPSTAQPPPSAAVRLRTLEKALEALSSRSPVVSDILDLHQTNPSLFHADSETAIPTDLPLDSLAALVLAHGQLYTTVSANLHLLRDTPLAHPATGATKLIALQPRIDAATARQEAQGREFAELSLRSAKALEAWYEGGVLEMGEHWADWEERMREMETKVRRLEAVRKREAEGLV